MDTAGAVRVEELLAHREWVQGFARALVRDPNDADDLVQDAWASALRSPPRAGTSVRSWFAAVLRNRARDGARHRAVADAHRGAALPVGASEPSPADLLERAETERRAITCVLALDEPFRDAVLLRFRQGKTPQEIAELRGVPPATVRTRIHRALAEVRRRMDEEDRAGRWRAVFVASGGGTGGGTDGGTDGAVPAPGSPQGKGAPPPAASAAAKAAGVVCGAAIVIGVVWAGSGDRRAEMPGVAAAPDRAAPRAPMRSGRAAPPTDRAEGARAGAAATQANPVRAGVDVPVHVVSADGAPVEGAEVDVLVLRHGKPGTDAVPAARSDAAGRTTVVWDGEPARVRVVARVGDRAAVSPPIEFPSPEPVELRLEPTVVLAGTVSDTEGRPVAGALLSLESDLGAGIDTFTRARSAADGRFAFAPMPASLHDDVMTVAAGADGYATSWVLVRQAGGPGALDIRLEAGRVITGRVVDASGNPLAAVDVEVTAGDTVTTDAEGRFTTGALPAAATRLGFLTETHAAASVVVPADAPGRFDVGDVTLRPGLPVRGIVVRADGTPARNVWVGVEDPAVSQFVRQSMTDDEGRFAFDHLADGPLRVAASATSNGPDAGASAELDDVRAGAGDVRLTLSAGRSVLVRIRDAATGVPVRADSIVVNTRPAGTDSPGMTTVFDVRDGAASVRMSAPAEGRNEVRVRVNGYEEAGPFEVDITPDGAATLDVDLVRRTPPPSGRAGFGSFVASQAATLHSPRAGEADSGGSAVPRLGRATSRSPVVASAARRRIRSMPDSRTSSSRASVWTTRVCRCRDDRLPASTGRAGRFGRAWQTAGGATSTGRRTLVSGANGRALSSHTSRPLRRTCGPVADGLGDLDGVARADVRLTDGTDVRSGDSARCTGRVGIDAGCTSPESGRMPPGSWTSE